MELEWNPPPGDTPSPFVECLTLQRYRWRKDSRQFFVWHGTDKHTGIIYFAAIPVSGVTSQAIENA
jgi:hypothetical protein